jgi:3-oxoacyl-[acyl-carrier protein] reductase
MELDIRGKVAIVTGASSGIGRATALALAKEDVRLILSGRREDELKQTAISVVALGSQAHYVLGDLAKDTNIPKEIVSQSIKKYGQVDILINCAAETIVTGTVDVSLNLWSALFENLLLSTVRMCDVAIPEMRKQRVGRIVNISSSAVKDPSGAGPYDAFKSALVSYTKNLANELASDGILANCICPGSTLTSMWTGSGKIGEQLSAMTDQSIDEVLADIADGIPLGRLANPEEIADVILFLASARSSYITGACIFVDGGQTATPF